MDDFFKSWQRRIGIVLLVMACMVTAGWVRSPFVTDTVSYATGTYSMHIWFSADGSFGLIRDGCDSEKFFKKHPDLKLAVAGPNFPAWQTMKSGIIDLSTVKWQWRWMGFDVGENEEDDGHWWTYVSIPYWSIVIPLTLISSWLLLSKRRQTTSKKFAEPIQGEGGGATS